MSKIVAAVVILLTLLLTGCGGGGTASPAPPPGVVFKLFTNGTLPPGSNLSAISITVILPAGITVATDSNGAVANNVVVSSGVTSQNSGTQSLYTAATATSKATLQISLASTSANGFGVGEFAAITCASASDTSPDASAFSLQNFAPADLFFNPVNGLTATIAAITQ